MNANHALRYLLLRHLKQVESVVGSDKLSTVANSLVVFYNTNAEACVKWKINNIYYEKIFPKGYFVFWERADIKAEERKTTDSVANLNNLRAREFIEEVFEINLNDLVNVKQKLDPYLKYNFLELTIYAILLLNYSSLLKLELALLITVFGIGLFHKTNNFFNVIFPLLGFVSPGFSVTSSPFLGVLNFLNPVKKFRIIKTIYPLCGVLFLFQINPINLNFEFFSLVIASIVYIILRSLYGFHFKQTDFLFPFVLIGLYLDSQITNLLPVIIYLLVMSFYKAFIFSIPLRKRFINA